MLVQEGVVVVLRRSSSSRASLGLIVYGLRDAGDVRVRPRDGLGFFLLLVCDAGHLVKRGLLILRYRTGP